MTLNSIVYPAYTFLKRKDKKKSCVFSVIITGTSCRGRPEPLSAFVLLHCDGVAMNTEDYNEL